jgi:uncharacterized protein DUF6166
MQNMLVIPRAGIVLKRYKGRRLGQIVDVTVNGHPLDPRFDLCANNSARFEWGYGGNGPARLALALLADHLADDARALNLYKSFNFEMIAQLSGDNWEMTSHQIEITLQRIR